MITFEIGAKVQFHFGASYLPFDKKEIVENVLHGRNYLIMVAGVAIGCMTPWPPLHSEI